MASDGTGWQDNHIEKMKNYNACIIWNSKRPSGTTTTIKFLKNIVEDGKSFYLYFSSNLQVNYRASIIDFVENQEDLDEKKWDEKYTVFDFKKEFSEFKDDNKSAKIVFLAESIEKIEPLPVSKFKFYGKYKAPTQDNLQPIKEEPNDMKSVQKSSNKKENIIPLNQIFYGPPGTGKTYKTKEEAVKIADKKFFENLKTVDKNFRDEIIKKYNELVKSSQIVFTTFHQSMSYEDFVEGIKPLDPKENNNQVVYDIKEGIFKELSEAAKISKIKQSNSAEFRIPNLELKGIKYFKMSLGDSNIEEDQNIYNYCIENGYVGLGYGEDFDFTSASTIKDIRKVFEENDVKIKDKNDSRLSMVTAFVLEMKKNDIVFISNGNKIVRAVGRVSDNKYVYNPNSTIRYSQFRKVEWLLKNVEIPVKSFYKRYLTQRSIYKLDSSDLDLSIFEHSDKSNKNEEAQNFVLIIDEINRGNVSAIFGELITLIEEDKRSGKDEAITVTLPYSKQPFSVSDNLYIIGTMNTADRSVEALDTALRRRFSFVEFPPKYDLLYNKEAIEEIDLKKLLETINNRIEVLLDRDHLIGHSYFLNIDSIKKLKSAFANQLIPLLQEYFYGDYGKIALVLGEGFCHKKKNDKVSFAPISNNYDTEAFNEKVIYVLENVSKMEDENFKEAIKTLVNK